MNSAFQFYFPLFLRNPPSSRCPVLPWEDALASLPQTRCPRTWLSPCCPRTHFCPSISTLLLPCPDPGQMPPLPAVFQVRSHPPHQFVDFRYKDIETIPVLATAYYLFTFSTNVSYNNKKRKMEAIQAFSNKKNGSVNYRKKTIRITNNFESLFCSRHYVVQFRLSWPVFTIIPISHLTNFHMWQVL